MRWPGNKHQTTHGDDTAQPLAVIPSPAASDVKLEKDIQTIGGDLLEAMGRHEQGMFTSGFWSSRLMAWATQDAAFKTQLFRLVDVFPVLEDDKAIARHVQEYLRRDEVTLPTGMAAGLSAGALLPAALARTMTHQIQQMARNFIAGRNVAQALPELAQRWQQGQAFSLDLLGEACVSQQEALAYQKRYLDLIESMAAAVGDWPDNPTLTRDHLGLIPRVNVSVKVSSLTAKFDPMAPEASMDRVLDMLAPLLQKAAELGVFINFDMEQFAYKDLTIALFKAAATRWNFPAGIAIQAYLRSGPADAQNLIDWSLQTRRQITVRLVKGAYWDYEVAHAQQQGWPIPVWLDKHQTDACFEAMTRELLAACPKANGRGGVKLALGSHNVRSVAVGLAMRRQLNLPPEAIEFQMLRGMADSFKAAMVEQQFRLREYVPISELVPGMAYLVRRLLENTSNQSWLLDHARQSTDHAALLALPGVSDHVIHTAVSLEAKLLDPAQHTLTPTHDQLADGRAFANEPVRDFSQENQRRLFARAIAQVKLATVDQNHDENDAQATVSRSLQAFDDWTQRPVVDRANLLIRTADLMRQQRDELAGIVIHESAKTWRDADADICEAIDFLNYYARQAVSLVQGQPLGQFLAQDNHFSYHGRGVSVIISPWNFPLAICAGMTSAALVTGNTAIVKPAEQSPAIAQRMVSLFHQAGVPEEVVQLMAGQGEVVGRALARDGRVANIAFTGSRQVGLELMRVAADTQPQQTQTKRLICEMGGKNAIIIDTSADPDTAVAAVRDSAFGYAGQKCSACSRVIIVGDQQAPASQRFIQRLIESTRALKIGDPLDPDTDIGPVIDQEAAAKIHQYIDLGHQEGQLVYAGSVPDGLAQRIGRAFVAPHIFTNVAPHARLAQEEIFGPVLAILYASTFQHAITIANDCAYKLTGSVISRTPSHLALARERYMVGNLYLNRGCTGALVGRQPFGGFGLSGIGEKAGGPGYLQQFMDSKITTENTLRSGFSPQILKMMDQAQEPRDLPE